MRKQPCIVAAVLVVPALWGAGARAQPVFFVDEFNGAALVPQWMQPPAGHWAYNVTGGMLNVTGLFSPNIPPAPNSTQISSGLEPSFNAFEATVRMGMDAGTGREIRYTVLSLSGSPIASFAWSDEGAVSVQTTGLPVMFPAPSMGIHEFTVRRSAGQYGFLLDGHLLTTLTGEAAIFGHMELRFTGPSTGALGPMHVDRVIVLASIGSSCYANCDGSSTPPVLNVNDFICFQNRFNAGNLYANCDGSSTPPVLNVNDFICFLNTYATGCT